jgi:hypothetical protein
MNVISVVTGLRSAKRVWIMRPPQAWPDTGLKRFLSSSE